MTEETLPQPIYWTNTQKITFRFIFCLFVLFILLNPNGVLFVSHLFELVLKNPVHGVIVWIGNNVLHLPYPITTFGGGSGDSTYNYVLILFIAVLSLAGAIAWSVIDRAQRNYNKLFYWLCVVIRFYVAITMASYGYVKVIKLQFPSPSLSRLLEPYGNSSPMGLAWTYVGFSAGYNYFTGMAEILCAMLLFFRRTTTLGAILGLVVAGNIMAINYCFDIPVKIMSTALVLMCLLLLVKDMNRLISFFILNKPAPAANLTDPRFNAKWKNIAAATFKYLLIAYVLVGFLISSIQSSKRYGDKAPKPAFYGIYDVKSFVINNVPLPPLTTDTTRWNKLIIDQYSTSVRLMNDSTKYYQLSVDTSARTFTFKTDKQNYVLNYSGKNGKLLLSGKWDDKTMQIHLAKYDLRKFRLINRGFHWINEYPYNR